MRLKLLEFLCCPKCQNQLKIGRIKKQDQNHIHDGLLKCVNCFEQYPIKTGIPIFTQSLSAQQNRVAKAYQSLFKLYRQNVFGRGKLYGKDEKQELKDFFEMLSIKPKSLQDKIVVDAGCGQARLTKNLASYAKEIIGFDIHHGLNNVFQQTQHLTNVHIVKADVLNIPLKKQTADKVWCEGVLPFTPDPLGGLSALQNITKPNGQLYAFFYSPQLLQQELKLKILKQFHLFKYPPLFRLTVCRIFALSILSYVLFRRRQNNFSNFGSLVNNLYDYSCQGQVTYLNTEQINELINPRYWQTEKFKNNGQIDVVLKRIN